RPPAPAALVALAARAAATDTDTTAGHREVDRPYYDRASCSSASTASSSASALDQRVVVVHCDPGSRAPVTINLPPIDQRHDGVTCVRFRKNHELRTRPGVDAGARGILGVVKDRSPPEGTHLAIVRCSDLLRRARAVVDTNPIGSAFHVGGEHAD